MTRLNNVEPFIGERDYVTFTSCRRKSVRGLSLTLVNLVHLTQRVELFGNILHYLIAYGHGAVFVTQFFSKNIRRLFEVIQQKHCVLRALQ